MSQDPLKFLPLEQWSELQSVFKNEGLRGIPGFSLLDTQRRLQAKGVDYGFKVYCPFGDVKNGMVAFNEKDKYYEIIILCPSDDTENLMVALRKTHLIDWERDVTVPFAQYNVIGALQELISDLDLEIRIFPSHTFVLDSKQPSPFEDNIILPENVTLGLLTPKHVELVNSTWPHRYATSTWYFNLLISNQCGYGLFLGETLACWVFISDHGTLLHLYTVEEYRRRGFAELLLKLVSNILLREGRNVIAYCMKNNINACPLYKKTKFVEALPIAWCYLTKKNKINCN